MTVAFPLDQPRLDTVKRRRRVEPRQRDITRPKPAMRVRRPE